MKIESGTFSYGKGDSNWILHDLSLIGTKVGSKEKGGRVTDYKIRFQQRFTKPPTVVVNISGFDVSNKADARIDVHPMEIKNEEFTIVFSTSSDSIINSVSGTWIAYIE